jgi:hypothetical protein
MDIAGAVEHPKVDDDAALLSGIDYVSIFSLALGEAEHPCLSNDRDDSLRRTRAPDCPDGCDSHSYHHYCRVSFFHRVLPSHYLIINFLFCDICPARLSFAPAKMYFYLLKAEAAAQTHHFGRKISCAYSATTGKKPSQVLEQCVLDRHDPWH